VLGFWLGRVAKETTICSVRCALKGGHLSGRHVLAPKTCNSRGFWVKLPATTCNSS
jgi:hypothetical protein